MATRTSTTVATFLHPFLLVGLEQRLPPGTYDIETEEEALEGISFVAYRRVSTHLIVRDHATGSTQMMWINPKELEFALKEDAIASSKV